MSDDGSTEEGTLLRGLAESPVIDEPADGLAGASTDETLVAAGAE